MDGSVDTAETHQKYRNGNMSREEEGGGGGERNEEQIRYQPPESLSLKPWRKIHLRVNWKLDEIKN